MLKKTIKYEDFNGVEREEDFYFNLTEAELIEMELSKDGGIDEYAKRISREMNGPKLVELFKQLILKAYGVKSDDGKNFRKSPEIIADFVSTNAYSVLFTELGTNSEEAAKFFTGIIPKDKAKLAEEEMKKHPELFNK